MHALESCLFAELIARLTRGIAKEQSKAFEKRIIDPDISLQERSKETLQTLNFDAHQKIVSVLLL
jgi:hypothetical protein